MTSPKLLGAAALAACLLATPAFAQMTIDPARCSGPFPDASCQNYGRAYPATYRHHHHTAHRYMTEDSDWNRTHSGFGPVDTAGAVAGAAVGTAAAVATAPFRGYDNSYASYDHGGTGWYGDWDSYAARNGIVCRPGTYFKGEDGRQHLCQ